MTEMSDFMEQLDAAHDIAHHYTCFVCNEFEGHTPVIIAQEDGDGVRVMVVTVCITCAKEVPHVTAPEPSTTKT